MMRTCCYTSFTYSYLSRARVLLRTLRSAQPDWTVCAVIVDLPPPGIAAEEMLAGFDQVLTLDDLGIPRVRSWLFKHDIVEACTAVKGAALLRLLAEYDRVIYLDPDVALFGPLDPALDSLAGASVLLTPHQTAPNRRPAAVRDNEAASLRYGVFNLGFLAVRADADGLAFAGWWAEQLQRACYDEPGNGLFTDQKYVDLAPCLFPGVGILRDPGCNVASWNISTRQVRIGQDGAITVNGAPLRFCHFTKVGGVGDVMLDRYAGDNIEALEIWAWYRRQLAHQPPPVPPGWWAYGSFGNGVPVTGAMRHLFRRRPDLMAAFDEPLFTDGEGYFTWLGREHPDMLPLPPSSATAIPAATAAF